MRKLVAEVGLILALATMVYTGVLLGAAPGRPLWNSPLVPVLFAVSGLSAGIALTVVLASSAAKDKAEAIVAIDRVHKVDSYVIVTEIIVLAALLGSVLTSSFTGNGSVGALVSGQFSLLFWIGLVVIGFIIPLTLQAYASNKKRSFRSEILVSSFAVAISGFVLRYLILSAGYSTPIPYVTNFFELVPAPTPTLGDYLVTAGLFSLLAVVFVVASLLMRSQKPRAMIKIEELGVGSAGDGQGLTPLEK